MALWKKNNAANDDGLLLQGPAGARVLDEDEIDLKEIFALLKRRRKIIMLSLSLSLLVASVVLLFKVPLYRADLTMQIDRMGTQIVQYQDVTPAETVYDRDFYQTQYELLKSRSLAQRVIDELGLNAKTQFNQSGEDLNNYLSKMFADVDRVEDITEDWLVSHFLKNLSVEPVRNSRLVKIGFTSPSPEMSAEVVNTLGRVFINMNLEKRFDASSYAKSFLEDRLQIVKNKLEESEEKMLIFAREKEIISISDKQNITVQKLADANKALIDAEDQRIEAESLYNELSRSDENSLLPEIQSSPVLQKLKKVLSDLQAEYNDKLEMFKPSYPAMLQLQGKINSTVEEIQREVSGIRESFRLRYQTAEEKERLHKDRVAGLKEAVLQFQDNSIRYNILKREVDTNRELYEGLLQRMKEIGVAGGIGANNIFIVDAAKIPTAKYSPRALLYIAVAVLLGLLAGTVLVLVLEFFDDTIKNSDQFEHNTRLPLLGIIPTSASEALGSGLAMMTHQDPTSALAEAYRSVRTGLTFATVSGAPKTLLVTSSGPGEGKTTSTVNIATAFAQTRKNVLIIDADLRNPSIQKALNLNNYRGLSNYLSSELNEMDLIHTTDVPRLFVMTAGPQSPNPAELLSSEKMSNLLDKMRDQFDYIIIDGPPVLGLADAVVLGSQAEATLFVVEAAKTKQKQLELSLGRMNMPSIRIVGGILTKVSSLLPGYGYYSEYYQYDKLSGQSAKKLTSG